jgi:hypothetical protein
MALTHLADTSVLKRLDRPAVQDVVGRLGRADALARSSLADLEVGFSARTAVEWDRLVRPLATFGLIETHERHVVRALEVQRMLAERSQRGRTLPDLIAAAAAEAEGLTVLHYDADFDRIAVVTGQPVEWVVPRGSVD